MSLSIQHTAGLLLPGTDNKDHISRLSQFVAWLHDTGRNWTTPDLAAYRDALRARGLAPTSVRAHLSTIRGRYAQLMRDNRVRDSLYELARATLDQPTPADAKAFVDEALTRLEHDLHPDNAPVRVVQYQDVDDALHYRLTAAQANALLAAPDVDHNIGMRDAAIIAMLLCTGLREAELCALEVDDMRVVYGGALSVRVREGKGAKQRIIPYGDLEWVLALVDAWLRRLAIYEGPVFRGFYKGARKVRPTPITPRAVQYILSNYPIMIDGDLVTVRPHDLRRTYARRLYEAGVELVAIQQNLGHADLKTTLGYIGALDADSRRPPSIYHFDLSRLR